MEENKKNTKAGNTSILIIEDDGINQFYLNSILNKKYKTFTSFTSENAIKILKNHKIDLILTDILLRGNMNGLEFTKFIKSSDEFSSIPVIAITGYTNLTDRQKFFDAGCIDFILKPFDEDELLRLIKRHLK